MAFTSDGIAPPGIPLLGCSPPNHNEVQNGLWRIYNCTKAGNRRAKRGGPRKSEGGVRVEPSEADAFIDFRTRFCYSCKAIKPMISKFYCLTSISPKDNNQFEGLHHKVGNKERVLLNFLKLTFGSMHIKSNSEFKSKLERTSDLFLLVCFGHFFNTTGLQNSLSTPLPLLSLSQSPASPSSSLTTQW